MNTRAKRVRSWERDVTYPYLLLLIYTSTLYYVFDNVYLCSFIGLTIGRNNKSTVKPLTLKVFELVKFENTDDYIRPHHLNI